MAELFYKLNKEFFPGGGEMGALLRAKNWNKTQLGPPQYWPQSLHTTLSILLNSRFPMFLFWGSSLICFYNDAYRPSLGNNGKHPGALGNTAENVWPEIWGIIGPLIEQVMTTGVPTWSVDQLIPIFRNGIIEDVYWTFSYSPVNDESNKPLGVFVTCTETTKDVIAAQNFKKNINNLYSIIRQAPVAMCILKGPHFVVEVVNNRILELWGKSEAAVIGKPIFEGLPDARHQGFEELLLNVYLTGITYTADGLPVILFRHSKIETVYVNFVYEAYREPDGTISGVMVVATDVTQQVTATNKLQESEAQLSLLANNIQNLGWIADGEGNIYWYNQRWYQYTGTNLEDIKQSGWEKLYHPDDKERVMDFIKKAWKKSEPWELTFALRAHNGDYHWFLTRAFPISDTEGNITQWTGTNTNIDEQKSFAAHLEKMVVERTVELNHKNILLEQQNLAFEKLNQELESFAYISSHDLQEPLRKIQTFIKLIVDKEINSLSEGAKSYFTLIDNAASRMKQLIDDLLSYSSIARVEKFTKTNLNDLLEEVKEDLHEKLIASQAIIQSGDLPEMEIVHFQFKQLLTNLISNSIKFSQPGISPVIKISSTIVEYNNGILKTDDGLQKHYLITISDNGIGFEPEYNEQIFKVFQRLHGRSAYEGTGIGLAIVKKIVENHNGIITATGIPHNGTVFNIYIPVTPPVNG